MTKQSKMEKDYIQIELDLSNHAAAVSKIINEVKAHDPIKAGQLYTKFDSFIRQNAPTTTVFSLKELYEYGYIH